MSDFSFPGMDLSDPFIPSLGSVSVYSPLEYSTPKSAVKPPHDYGTFTYPITPEDERPNPISLPPRSRDLSSKHPPSLSHSRSSSVSSKFSFSSPTPDVTPNQSSNAKWEPLTSFTHFASLPLDIQRNIWKHTLSGPQIIEIYQCTARTPQSSSSTSTTTPTPKKQDILPRLKTRTALPIALRIHHLSRRLALYHLTSLAFAQPYYLPSNPYAYIDYTHDTLFLSSHTLYPNLGNHILYSRNLHRIRYLALEFPVWCKLLGDNNFVSALLEMEELMSIEIIFEKEKRFASNKSSSSIVSKSLGDSLKKWKDTNEGTNTLEFLDATEKEEMELEDIFERECEKYWVWGRVGGWEDIRGKLRFRWRGGDSCSASRISSQDNRRGETHTRLRPGCGAKGDIKIGYQELRNSGTSKPPRKGLECLENLLSILDDLILDYGYVAQGRGEWSEVLRGCGVGVGDVYSASLYSESVYSESVCSASFEDNSDLEGWI